MTGLTLEQAYAEACRLLGEALVREAMMAQEIERLTRAHQTVVDELTTRYPSQIATDDPDYVEALNRGAIAKTEQQAGDALIQQIRENA